MRPLPTVVIAAHALEEVAIFASCTIIIFFLFGLGAPFAAMTLGYAQVSDSSSSLLFQRSRCDTWKLASSLATCPLWVQKAPLEALYHFRVLSCNLGLWASFGKSTLYKRSACCVCEPTLFDSVADLWHAPLFVTEQNIGRNIDAGLHAKYFLSACASVVKSVDALPEKSDRRRDW